MIQQLLLDEETDESRVSVPAVVPIPAEPPLIDGRLTEFVRRTLNSTFALISLVLLSPVLLVLGILIRLESPGPIFYKGLRVGRNGRLFTMYKLRTLKVGAEKEIGLAFARLDAPYATRLGRLLRQSKADEIPQLLNVMRGEMSLVGPRPVRPICAEHFSRRLPGYAEQFRVRPGITGLSQMKAGDQAHASLKLKYDLEYLGRRSIIMDLNILAMTGAKITGLQFRLLARKIGNLSGPATLSPQAGNGRASQRQTANR